MCGKGEQGHPSFYESFATSRSAYNDFPINLMLATHEIMRNLVIRSKYKGIDYIGSESYKIIMDIDSLSNVMGGCFEVCSKSVPAIVDTFLKFFKSNKKRINDNDFINFVSNIKKKIDNDDINNDYGISICGTMALIIEIESHIEENYRVIDGINFYINKNKNIEFS